MIRLKTRIANSLGADPVLALGDVLEGDEIEGTGQVERDADGEGDRDVSAAEDPLRPGVAGRSGGAPLPAALCSKSGVAIGGQHVGDDQRQRSDREIDDRIGGGAGAGEQLRFVQRDGRRRRRRRCWPASRRAGRRAAAAAGWAG